MKLAAWFAPLCLLAAASGCARFERISECTELTQTVNEHMTELDAVAKAKESPQSFAKLADGYEKLADEVAALPVAKGAASAQVAEYVGILRSASKSSRETSAALKAGEKTDAQRKELDRLARKDKLSAQKLDVYCQSP